MNALKSRRPSPATALAALALVFAVGGTALAGPDPATRAVSKAKVKKIATKAANRAIDAKSSTLSVNSANTAGSARTADRANTADSAKIATNIFSANVLLTGTALGSVPEGVTAARNNVGEYTVTFPRPVSGCTITAGPGSPDSASETIVGVRPQPDVGPNSVLVFTSNRQGNEADRDFYVQMICPAG